MRSLTDRSTGRDAGGSTDTSTAIERLERLFLLDDASSMRQPEPQPAGNSFWLGVGITSILAMSVYLVGQKAPDIEKVWKQATASVSPTIKTVVPSQVTSGLSATRTTLTGVIDPESMTAAYYLSTILKNSTASNQEAQMKIALPAGAAVTRATLWINGQAQEAAFTDRNTAQQAFDWVVQGRRDPLLVKQIDARTVEVIGNPIMPGGDGMKIRIGITAPLRLLGAGEVAADLPKIETRNFADGSYDVHLESSSAIISTAGDVTRTDNNSLLRLHKNSVVADLPQITFTRHMSSATFATRATHSLDGGYIVATVSSDDQTHETKVSLRKQLQKPGKDIPILNSKDAAARVSTLWAKSEIEQFAREGDETNAVALAHVYRVVSPVSSAVVLEQQSDYDRFMLNRNQWESMRANEHHSSGRQPMSVDKDVSRPIHVESPFPSAMPLAFPRAVGGAPGVLAQPPAPVIQGGNSLGPAAATPAQDSTEEWTPPGSDAAAITGVSTIGTVRPQELMAFLLGVLNFAPGVVLAVRGTRRFLRKQVGAEKLFLLSATWLVLAATLPVLSQILAVAMAVLLLMRRSR